MYRLVVFLLGLTLVVSAVYADKTEPLSVNDIKKMIENEVEHELIIQAVCAGDSRKADKQMRNHLQNLKKELVKIMKLANYPSN